MLAQKSDTSAVKSADRALDILEFVAAASSPVTFMQLVTGLKIPKSSLFQLLKNLADRHYLHQQEGGYVLGGSIAKLAKGVAPLPLPVLVNPALQKLTAEVGETSGFYVRRGDVAEPVAAVFGCHQLTYTIRLGDRAPLHTLSAGKIILARSGRQDWEDYLRTASFQRITPNTITSAEILKAQLERAAEDGYATAREEYTLGITGIAVAVELAEAVVGSVNVVVPTARFTADRAEFIRERLHVAAASITQVLSAHGLSVV